MTETEIKKALECCIDEDNEFTTCDGCVFIECKMGKERECTYYMLKSVLSLINRKNAEIDRLTAVEKSHQVLNGELRTAVERLNFENLQMVASIKGLEERARAEAIKEVFGYLKDHYTQTLYEYDKEVVKVVSIDTEEFDQIAKEMGCVE